MRMISLIALILLIPLNAAAWNEPGHRVIAEIAWDNMDAGARSAAIDILQNHPDFERGFRKKMPRSLDGEARDRWIFRQAAAWPQVARNTDYARPSWHYISLPIYVDEEAEQKYANMVSSNIRTDLPSNPADMDQQGRNIAQALKAAMAVVESPDTSPADRALALSWVMNLTGDIHQPLHTASLFGLPGIEGTGDRNGARICVRNKGKWIRPRDENVPMLWWWERAISSSEAISKIEEAAAQNQAAYASGVSAADRSAGVDTWLAESYELAKTVAYPDQLRREAAKNVTGQKCATHSGFIHFPQGYVANGRDASEKQSVVAGMRLAEAMNNTLN